MPAQNSQTVTLDFASDGDRMRAASFLACLVAQGVTFKAQTAVSGEELVITFTGGY